MDKTDFYNGIWNGSITQEELDYEIIHFGWYTLLTNNDIISPTKIVSLSEDFRSFSWRVVKTSFDVNHSIIEFKTPFISDELQLCWLNFCITITSERTNRSEKVKYNFEMYDTYSTQWKKIRKDTGIELYANILNQMQVDEQMALSFNINETINAINYYSREIKSLDFFLSKKRQNKWVDVEEKSYNIFTELFDDEASIISAKCSDVSPALRLYLVSGLRNKFIPECINYVIICTANKVGRYKLGFGLVESNDKQLMNKGIADGLIETETIKYPSIKYDYYEGKNVLQFRYWR